MPRKRDSSSSDNPEKAIISLKNDRETSYKVYIAVQNELVAAYNDLRDREFARLNPLAGLSYTEAQKRYNDPRTSSSDKAKLKPKLDEVKAMYPQKLSEARTKKSKPTKKTLCMSKFKKKKAEIYLRFQPHLYQISFSCFCFSLWWRPLCVTAP